MNASPPLLAPAWPVRRATLPHFADQWPALDALGPEWQPLGQSWREGLEDGFNPGWARLRWHAGGLLVEGVFRGTRQANRARQLNERTWELGSVFELFLRAEGYDRYVELHITPENQRLQLLWPDDGLASFRAGRSRLADYLVTDPAWVKSETRVSPGGWAVRAEVSFRCVGLAAGASLPAMRAAVCRYDLGRDREILSSTARLPVADYHLQSAWSRLQLVG